MLKLASAHSVHFAALAVCAIFTVVGSAQSAVAAPQEQADSTGQARGEQVPRKKKLGDVSYRTMWRMQQRIAAMLPRNATMISPILRLSLKGMAHCDRAEFQPESWAVAIVGKTVDASVQMRRGGYFEVPALPQAQARSEDAIMIFNSRERKNWFDVGWQVNVPSAGTLAYTQFGQALAELKHAQNDIPWWDIMAIPEKNAQFNAIRACFASDTGKILIGGEPAGKKISTHCSLLAFDPLRLDGDPAIDFVGGLEIVTLDNTANYAPELSNVL